MKTIKKAILLALFVLMSTLSQVVAQPMNRAGLNAPGIQYLITEYGDELELTDDQKSELIALQLEHRNEWRADNREMFQNRRGDFRRGKRDGRQGPRGQGFRNADPQFMQARTEARMEMRQEVMDILTGEQQNLLQSNMIEKAEKAHEFRTLRHQSMVDEAGIEGEKADQVLNLLNAQSANRLELDKQRVQNPTEVAQELWTDHFEKMRETNDQLQSILTVDEYQELRQHMGFGRRENGNRGLRRWSQ
ncbi:Spy/CpxP family protein refolding chaperone [Rhodohalobacter sulfatireducens]|uniref:Spy/CpxP family protein refolding chaperone n=1 Tax=Rhodohalobacter sulfatireducens TaxID=2911366 RepID=A0ABS9KC93_9BACT|nr:Spy/CpxP family protein refolding chaperone [Rhodohalobacter sulfatireducens]MCG2588474.1 Spy/CpxP family protein refolding chaperone [Rhodohalobacter sulfatireducens]